MMPAIRNIPPYSSVRRIRMVGLSHGNGLSAWAGSQVGFGGADGGAGFEATRIRSGIRSPARSR